MAAKAKREAEDTEPTPEPAVKAKARKKGAEASPAGASEAKGGMAVASGTAPKAGTPATPRAEQAPAKASPRTSSAKSAAPVKLTVRQLEFLRMIHGARDEGFLLGRKADQRTIDALMDRKLIKKGAKDRASGNFRYSVSKRGEEHLTSSPPSA